MCFFVCVCVYVFERVVCLYILCEFVYLCVCVCVCMHGLWCAYWKCSNFAIRLDVYCMMVVEFTYLPIYLPIYLYIYLSIYLSIYILHIYLSIYLSMHLFLYSLPMCLFIWLSKSIDRLINESLNLSDGACTWKGFFCLIKEMFSSDKILQQRWSPHVSYS